VVSVFIVCFSKDMVRSRCCRLTSDTVTSPILLGVLGAKCVSPLWRTTHAYISVEQTADE